MERYSWAVGIDEDTGLITVEDARLSVSALVTPSGAITSRSGLIPAASTPGNVTATSPTPNGFVHVSPFRAVLQSQRGGGTYIWCLDEIKSLDVLTAAPADPANPRRVLVVWQQSDTFFTDPDSDFEVRLVVGDPAAIPVDPEVTGSDDYVVRARITVPANATDIETADIELLPLPWTVATGGILPIRTQAERTAITAPYEGLAIYRIDRDWEEKYDGAGWRVVGTAVCSSTADRDSAITHPYNGQIAVTTDTGTVWVRQSGTWVRTSTVVEAVQSAPTLGMTTSLADITGCTTTVTTYGANREVKITATVDGESNGVTDIGIVVCVVDGVALQGEIHWGPTGRASYGRSWKTTLAAAGSHTIKLQGRKSGNTNTFTTYQTHTNLLVDVRHV